MKNDERTIIEPYQSVVARYQSVVTGYLPNLGRFGVGLESGPPRSSRTIPKRYQNDRQNEKQGTNFKRQEVPTAEIVTIFKRQEVQKAETFIIFKRQEVPTIEAFIKFRTQEVS